MRIKKLFLFVLLISVFTSCTEDAIQRIYPEDSSEIKILEEISSLESGIRFSNQMTENGTYNAVSNESFLYGAGVGILDVNNDNLMDIYFASNMTGDKLYLNKGDFKFEDISFKAGINNRNWSTGVAVVDINNDGFDDVYVCKFLYNENERRANVFYINNGDGTFTDRAAEMGIADIGFGIMSNFFDYDRDGDLDLYIANQPPNSIQSKVLLKNKKNYAYTDRLYRNDNGIFTDVTIESGIRNYSFSLSCTSFDFNKDGWIDIYVTCDYEEPDFLYLNNGDGTFTDVADTAMKHMSNFGMGVDIADINNDTHLDVFVADMAMEDNLRQKTNMSFMNPEKFYALANAGYHYQYMYNSMQLNNGDNSFSEIAQLSGISNTDWSWAPLFIDFDQDAYKDLIVTNGLLKEMRNKDFEEWRKEFMQKKLAEAEANNIKTLYVSPMEIAKRVPIAKVPNYIYRNERNLNFSKQTYNWGFDMPSCSHGASYADFDNDGDLDLVISNMNMEAALYRNTANDRGLNNYITIQLEGNDLNKDAIGAHIVVKSEGNVQSYDNTPYRGYMSCSQRIAHFGLGTAKVIDEIQVVWTDGSEIKLKNVSVNKQLTIKQADAKTKHNYAYTTQKQLFTAVKSSQ